MTNLEIFFRIAEIIIAVGGLVAVIIGWIVPYRQSLTAEKTHMENEKEIDKIRWRKELIDKQISELYGPINALLLEHEIRFNRVLFQIGRRHIIPKDKEFWDLKEDEQKIWIHFVDTYLIPLNLKMAEILKNKMHLLYRSEIDSSYKIFLDYALGWEFLDNQKRNEVPNHYAYHYSCNFPQEFNAYIRRVFEELLTKQGDLIKSLG